MNHELQTITFHEDEIFMVERQGEAYAPVRPICENIGLAWQSQHAKLTAEHERWNCQVIVTVGADGKQREMLCMPIQKVNGWLSSISVAKVLPEVKPKLICYQNECDEVLWNYWTKGKAVNNRTMRDNVIISKDDYIALLEEHLRLQDFELETRRDQRPKRRWLTAAEKAEILRMHADGVPVREISLQRKWTKNTIRTIVRRARIATQEATP